MPTYKKSELEAAAGKPGPERGSTRRAQSMATYDLAAVPKKVTKDAAGDDFDDEAPPNPPKPSVLDAIKYR